jgi:phosphoribosylformylglycinamidine synthase
MSVQRIYVEKKPEYAVEAKQLRYEIRHILLIKSVTDVRILNRYDTEGIDEELYRRCLPIVYSEPQLDLTFTERPADGGIVFAVEYLPGQFD